MPNTTYVKVYLGTKEQAEAATEGFIEPTGTAPTSGTTGVGNVYSIPIESMYSPITISYCTSKGEWTQETIEFVVDDATKAAIDKAAELNLNTYFLVTADQRETVFEALDLYNALDDNGKALADNANAPTVKKTAAMFAVADETAALIEPLPEAAAVTEAYIPAISAAKQTFDNMGRSDAMVEVLNGNTVQNIQVEKLIDQPLRDKLNADLAAIAQMVADAITALPEPESAKRADKPAVEAARDLLTQLQDSNAKQSVSSTLVNGLTADEAAIVTQALIDKLNALETELANVELVKQGVALDGKVGAAYKLALPKDVATLMFTGSYSSQVFDISEMEKNDDGTYTFNYHASPQTMNDNLTITPLDADGQPVAIDGIEGATTAMTAINVSAEDANPAIAVYAQAMRDYANATQIYNGYNLDKAGELSEAVKGEITITDPGKVSTGSIAGLLDGGFEVVRYSTTTLRQHFVVRSGSINDYTFKVNGTPVSALKSGPFYYVSVFGLNAEDLGDTQTIEVTKGGETLTLTYSALAFAKQNADSEDLNTQYLAKAMYRYNDTRKALLDSGTSLTGMQAMMNSQARPYFVAMGLIPAEGDEPAAPEVVELEIENEQAMFKAVSASLETYADGSRVLVFALSGTGYIGLYKGTYPEAVADKDAIVAALEAGESSGKTSVYYANGDGKYEFRVPLDEGQTFIPLISVSARGFQNRATQPIEEKGFYARQAVLQNDGTKLWLGDYDETAEFALSTELADFKAASPVSVQIKGGPVNNNYSVASTLVMQDATYDSVTYPSVVGSAIATKTAALEDGKFAIDMENAPNKKAFQDKIPLTFTFHVAESAPYEEAGTDVVRTVTFDQVARTIKVEGDPLTPKAAGASWKRLAGNDRWGTMASILDEGWESSDYAVIACGESFPDALSAAAVAGSLDCPVILTNSKSLNSAAASQIKRLGVKKAVVLGGTAAVSSDVVTAIKKLGVSIDEKSDRVYGNDRIGTSIAAMKYVKKQPGASSVVIVANGFSFADTLSISPWSYATKSPIVLTNQKGELTPEALTEIKNAGFGGCVIVGGNIAVSQNTQSKLQGVFGKGNVERVAGGNRYETAVEVAKWATGTNVLSNAKPGVAYGKNFPDALSSAALCGKNRGVLLLVEDGNQKAVDYLASNAGEIAQGYVFGGDKVVSEAVFNKIVQKTTS